MRGSSLAHPNATIPHVRMGSRREREPPGQGAFKVAEQAAANASTDQSDQAIGPDPAVDAADKGPLPSSFRETTKGKIARRSAMLGEHQRSVPLGPDVFE